MLIKDLFLKNIGTREIEENRQCFIKEYLNSQNKKVLYIHVPFCPSKCKYCICETKVCRDYGQLNEYVQIVKQQIDDYKEILDNIKFDQLYIGGGTPTIIEAKLMEKLFETVPDIEHIPLKSVECSPNTLSFEHIELFKKYTFSFISMGVQSLQQNICKWQNRYYITKEELQVLSEILRNSGIYFNYDMICYLGKGDIRDIPAFRDDLTYIMKYCQPSSVCVHQHHQIEFSKEKTGYLIKLLRELCGEYNYECVNSLLEDSDIEMDTMYQAQYRLVRENRDFNHYMWKRYPMVPVKGYDVLGFGFIDNIGVKSNAGNMMFVESKNQVSKVEYFDFVYDDFKNIRKIKHLRLD